MANYHKNLNILPFDSKSGKKINFRPPMAEDLHIMQAYINKLSLERVLISYHGVSVSIEEEKIFLSGQLKGLEDGTAFMLLAFLEDKLVGISGIDMLPRVEDHVGELGISIDKDLRGEGIGKALLERVIDHSKKILPKIEILTLKVYSENTSAINLYIDLGFEHYGSLPSGVKILGENMDVLLMYKELS